MNRNSFKIPLSEEDRQKLEAAQNAIENVIQMSNYLRNAYFWEGDNGNLQTRARRESQLCASAEWDENGRKYSAEIWAEQSRKYTYVHRCYTVDGKVTNLNAVRGSLRRINDALKADDAYKSVK